MATREQHRWRALSAIACFTALLCAGCAGFKASRDRNLVQARQFALQGTEALARGRYAVAEERLGRAVGMHPNDDGTRLLYADALWNRGQHQAAIDEMNQALRLSGGKPSVLVSLGRMHLSLDQLDQAEHYVDWAIRGNRSLASARTLKGDILQRRNKDQQALPHYHRALSLQPDPQVELAVAHIYYRQGRPQQALVTLQALASRSAPDQVPLEVDFLQGLALKSLGRFEDASERLMAVVNANSGHVDALFHLAEAQMRSGDTGNARIAAERALEIAPNHQAVRKLLTKLHKSDNRMAHAGQHVGSR